MFTVTRILSIGIVVVSAAVVGAAAFDPVYSASVKTNKPITSRFTIHKVAPGRFGWQGERAAAQGGILTGFRHGATGRHQRVLLSGFEPRRMRSK